MATKMFTFDRGAARKAGFSDEDIDKYLEAERAKGQKLNITNDVPRADATTATGDTSKGRGLLASVLPILGAVGGGIVGAPLGPAGIIAGGAAGGGFAEGLAQKISGEELDAKKIALNAAMGGVPFGRGAGIVSKFLKPGALVGGLGALTQDDATAGDVLTGATVGAVGAGATGPILSKVLGGLGSRGSGEASEQLGKNVLASKTLAPNFKLPNKIASELQIEKTLGEVLNDIPVGRIPTTMGGFEKLTKVVTGSDGAITKAYNNASREATKMGVEIDFGPALSNAKNYLDLQGGLVPTKVARETVASIRKYFDPFISNKVGHVTAEDALDIAKKLEKQGYNLYNKGVSVTSPRPDLEALGKAYIQAADDVLAPLSRSIDDAGLFAKYQQEVINKFTQAGLPKLAQKAASVKNITDLRSIAAPYARLSRAANITEGRGDVSGFGMGSLALTSKIMGGGAAAGFLLGGPAGAALGLGAGAALAPSIQGIASASQPALTGLAARGIVRGSQIAGKVATPISRAGANIPPKMAAEIPNALTRPSALMGVLGRSPQPAMDTEVAPTADGTVLGQTGVLPSMAGTDATGQTMQPTIGGERSVTIQGSTVTETQMKQAIMELTAAGQSKQAKALTDIYELAFPEEEDDDATLNNAILNVDFLEQIYGVGTDKSLSRGASTTGIGGLISGAQRGIQKKTDQSYADRLETYNQSKAFAIGLLNQARGAGVLNAGEFETMVANMPSENSSEAVAKNWFDNMRAIISRMNPSGISSSAE